MSQQVPPNNNGVPQGNDPQGGDMVVAGGYAEASSGYVSQGAGPAQYGDGSGLPPSYGPQSYARNRAPVIDPIESAKLTPQLMILLVLSGLKRHWKWSLPMGLILGLLAAGGLYLAQPVQHEAVAQIQIRAVRLHILEQDRQQGRYEDFVNTQLALLRSPAVIDRALEDSNVARLPIVLKQRDKRNWLTNKLRVNPVRRSEIVRISISADTEDAPAKIVNAVVDSYFHFIDENTRKTNRELQTGLRQEERSQSNLAQNLQESIRSKAARAAQQGTVAGQEGGTGFLVPGESLARDVAIAETQLTVMRARLRSIVNRMDNPSTLPTSMLINLNPAFKELGDRRDDLMMRRENLTQTLLNPEENHRVRDLDRQIEQIDERIRTLTGGVDRNLLQAMHNQLYIQEEMNKFQIEQDINAQEILVDELTRKYNEQLARSADRSEIVLDVSFEQAQLARANNTLDRIGDRLLALTAEARAPGQISQLSEAISSTPSRMRQFTVIAGGAVALSFFPLLLSIVVERMKPRLYHVSQVRRAIPQVLIGEIMEPPVSWVHGATFRKRLARYRESVHNWCTHLLLSDPFRSCRTLSVASVAGDDGKTFLAVQIAVAMAQMRAGKVLLIDGDMRVGRLHLLFGNEETGVGLADILSFRNLPGEAIVQNEKEPNLELLSAGQLDMSPYELLGDGRFRELLDALEQSPSNPSGYSLIIVVLPPVANAAESLIMAASTDSTLLCVRQGETVLAAMEDVYRKLVNTGTSVDGIVVKDIPYYQMAGRDGGFADKLEQIRLSHLLQYAD